MIQNETEEPVTEEPEAEEESVETTQAVQSAQTTTQAAVGASVGVGVVAAIASSSSSNSMFVSINQFQLYMLIPLTGAFIHKNILDYIKGFEFAVFTLNFIDFKQVIILKYPAQYYEFETDDEYLSSVGIEYQSTIRNMMSMILIFVILLLIHLLIVVPISSCSKQLSETSKCRKL